MPDEVHAGSVNRPNRTRGRNVPDGYLQSDHDEFVQNKLSERNGNDVQELVLEQDQGHDHNC